VYAQLYIPPVDRVAQLFAVCGQLGQRRGAIGRGIIALQSFFGLRPEDLAALTWHECIRDGNLIWLPQKTKKHRPFPMIAPLPATVVQQLDQLQRRKGAVFNEAKANRQVWNDLLDICGFTETTTDSEGRSSRVFTLATMRKFCNAQLNSVKAGAGEWIVGHSVSNGSKVNHRHYSDVYQAPDWVVAAMSDQRLTEPFNANGQQLSLFERS